jgi:hypothetical protein
MAGVVETVVIGNGLTFFGGGWARETLTVTRSRVGRCVGDRTLDSSSLYRAEQRGPKPGTPESHTCAVASFTSFFMGLRVSLADIRRH